jgi:hypothetical protein
VAKAVRRRPHRCCCSGTPPVIDHVRRLCCGTLI